LLGTAALGGVFEAKARTQSDQSASGNEVNKPIRVADDVYFHQGDIEHQGHCNNGWIVFEDYVLMIDANYPSGHKISCPKFAPSHPNRFGSRSIRIIIRIMRTETR
jgi:hypothetical protein